MNKRKNNRTQETQKTKNKNKTKLIKNEEKK